MSRISGIDQLLQHFSQQAAQERSGQIASQRGMANTIARLLAQENQSLGRIGAERVRAASREKRGVQVNLPQKEKPVRGGSGGGGGGRRAAGTADAKAKAALEKKFGNAIGDIAEAAERDIKVLERMREGPEKAKAFENIFKRSKESIRRLRREAASRGIALIEDEAERAGFESTFSGIGLSSAQMAELRGIALTGKSRAEERAERRPAPAPAATVAPSAQRAPPTGLPSPSVGSALGRGANQIGNADFSDPVSFMQSLLAERRPIDIRGPVNNFLDPKLEAIGGAASEAILPFLKLAQGAPHDTAAAELSGALDQMRRNAQSHRDADPFGNPQNPFEIFGNPQRPGGGPVGGLSDLDGRTLRGSLSSTGGFNDPERPPNDLIGKLILFLQRQQQEANQLPVSGVR